MLHDTKHDPLQNEMQVRDAYESVPLMVRQAVFLGESISKLEWVSSVEEVLMEYLGSYLTAWMLRMFH